MQIFYNLFCSYWHVRSHLNISKMKQINDFGVVVHCVKHYSACPFVCRQDGDILVSLEWCIDLPFLSCEVGGGYFCIRTRAAYTFNFGNYIFLQLGELCCWCPYFSRWEPLFYVSCFEVYVMFWILVPVIPYLSMCSDACAFSTNSETFSRFLNYPASLSSDCIYGEINLSHPFTE